ncbi:MAG: NTP transferase domain-containing protein [Pseudomonadota bacterium]
MILAAGRSSRFGSADKLTADLSGRHLASYAENAMRSCDLDLRAVVTGPESTIKIEGFTSLTVLEGSLQGASVARAAEFATEVAATHLLITLADMPFVEPGTLSSLLSITDDQATASTDGTRRMPPACFPPSDFQSLSNARGDAGARPILKTLPSEQLVHVPAWQLHDVDTQADLARAAEIIVEQSLA